MSAAVLPARAFGKQLFRMRAGDRFGDGSGQVFTVTGQKKVGWGGRKFVQVHCVKGNGENGRANLFSRVTGDVLWVAAGDRFEEVGE